MPQIKTTIEKGHPSDALVKMAKAEVAMLHGKARKLLRDAASADANADGAGTVLPLAETVADELADLMRKLGNKPPGDATS